jgi:hypothetical protein
MAGSNVTSQHCFADVTDCGLVMAGSNVTSQHCFADVTDCGLAVAGSNVALRKPQKV